MKSTGFDKMAKKLGMTTVEELGLLEDKDLKQRIVAAEQAMQQAKVELDNNEKYQEMRENLKALSAGKKEVNSRQKAVIEFCLYLLEDKE